MLLLRLERLDFNISIFMNLLMVVLFLLNQQSILLYCYMSWNLFEGWKKLFNYNQ